MPIDDDTSSSEGRFGNRPVEKSSGWASAAALVIAIIVVGLVYYYYRAKLVAP
jgi:ABC-type sugar transport system permease subunit